jgi:hypothetical protein
MVTATQKKKLLTKPELYQDGEPGYQRVRQLTCNKNIQKVKN